MFATRTPDAEEAAWLALVVQIPCIVCSRFCGVTDVPAEVHHIDGRNKPKSHLKTIPLCTNHHRVPDNERPKRWYSRHGDAGFEAQYALEVELLEMTQEEVAKLKKLMVGDPNFESH